MRRDKLVEYEAWRDSFGYVSFRLIEENWSVWDPDDDGSITLAEFVEPRRGLRE